MIREKSFEYHCKGSLMYMGMVVILLKWWAIYFLNRLIGLVTVTHSLQYMYMMIDRNPPLALFNNSTYSDKASQSIVKYLSIWVD